MSKRKVRMPLRSELLQDSRVEVVGDDFTYLARVHRLHVGDQIEVFNGTGIKADALVEEKGRKSIVLKIINKKNLDQIKNTHLILVQAITKAGKMGDIIRGATELGVDEVVPFVASRTIGRLSKTDANKKVERWQKIAAQASRQSERVGIPRIHQICDFHGLMDLLKGFDCMIILWEEEKTRGLKEVLKEQLDKRPSSIALCIGPEGGLSEEEVDLARKNGFVTASFGYRILRTETASLAALSIIQYELGDMHVTRDP